MVQGVFTAGDGDLSVVYQSAAHVWGSWGVAYTAGVEPEDFEQDRALGFVGDVGDTGGELASRMWVRADVQIDQDAQTSTVPQVFRDARERTSGEVVVTREVSGPGLGGLVPYVDFHHGDEIGTVIGSKVVPLPVNAITFTTDVDGGRDYVVSVGRGLLGNVRERDARNAELEAQIRSESRRAQQEADRLAERAARDREQAERDRQQTALIGRQQTTLANQQQQIKSWGAQVTTNNNKTRSLLIPQASGWTGVSRLARIILDKVPNLTQSDINFLNAIDSDTYTLGGTFANMYFAELNNP